MFGGNCELLSTWRSQIRRTTDHPCANNFGDVLNLPFKIPTIRSFDWTCYKDVVSGRESLITPEDIDIGIGAFYDQSVGRKLAKTPRVNLQQKIIGFSGLNPLPEHAVLAGRLTCSGASLWLCRNTDQRQVATLAG